MEEEDDEEEEEDLKADLSTSRGCFLLVDARCQGTMPPMLFKLAKRGRLRPQLLLPKPRPRRGMPRRQGRRKHWHRRQQTRLLKMVKSQVMVKVCLV
jgi:hypothetical protein